MSLDNTPTPKSKLTKILTDFVMVFAYKDLQTGEWWGHGTCLGDCEQEFIEAKDAIVSQLRELVPVHCEDLSHSYQKGFNACRNEMLKRLEGL